MFGTVCSQTDHCHMAQQLLQRGVFLTEHQQLKDTPLKRNCPHRRLAKERLVLGTADFLRAWEMVNSGKQNRRRSCRFHSSCVLHVYSLRKRRLAVERLVLDIADFLQAWTMVNSGKQIRRRSSRFLSTSVLLAYS